MIEKRGKKQRIMARKRRKDIEDDKKEDRTEPV